MTERRDRRALGRGLSALMGELSTDPVAPDRPRERDLQRVPVEQLTANPDQPRRTFPADAIDELAASIRTHGVLQPLIVRQIGAVEAPMYQIIAGERRWRAAQVAQVHEVPVIVRDLDDDSVLQIALVENIQRSDLGPLDEATAYRQLVDRFGHTQEHLAEALGKSRSHVANMLRLLQLPDEVRTLLQDGHLTAGHARALVGSTEAASLARRVVSEGLTVRDTEALVRKGPAKPSRRRGRVQEKDADTLALEAHLASLLRTGVSINHEEGGGGRLSIRYRDVDQLDQLCQLLSSSR